MGQSRYHTDPTVRVALVRRNFDGDAGTWFLDMRETASLGSCGAADNIPRWSTGSQIDAQEWTPLFR